MREEYGLRLSAWRKQQRLSQRALCAALEVSQGYISDIEAGRSEPSRNFLIKLQEKFGVRADYILYGDGEPLAAEAETNAKSAKLDPLLLMLCGGAVRRVYAELEYDLSPENHFAEAVWVYNELLSRMENPEDGDEMEAVLPEIRQVLKARLQASP
jgi:transcriptional regulator with XRE-family HTH domain